MMILRKIIHCKSLENYQKNIYDGLYFSKFASLQCKDWNSDVNGLHHSSFLEYVPKTICIKKKILKKVKLYQNFNEFVLVSPF